MKISKQICNENIDTDLGISVLIVFKVWSYFNEKEDDLGIVFNL